jgi:hypothetical protein
MHEKMEFPEDVLQIIRIYAKPRWTRPDWRTCKKKEANIICLYNSFIRYISSVIFYRHPLLIETNRWTLHGVTHLLIRLKRLLWPMDYPWMEDPFLFEWYIDRFRAFRFVPDHVSEQTIRNIRNPVY